MNKAAVAVSFILGAAIGSVATWKLLEKKCEQRVQEETESIKESLTNLYEKKGVKKEDIEVEPAVAPKKHGEKPGIMEYAAELRKQGYSDRSPDDLVDDDDGDIAQTEFDPYVIPPEQFGTIEEYDTISLSYYSDQVLADDNDEVIHNVNEIVGLDSLGHFGEYEDDSVYVRNERLKCDYEILLDQRRYSEVLEKAPYKAEM